MLSQMLTLYTTPVVFLYMDRFGNWGKRLWNRSYHGIMGDRPEDHTGGHAGRPSPSPAE